MVPSCYRLNLPGGHKRLGTIWFSLGDISWTFFVWFLLFYRLHIFIFRPKILIFICTYKFIFVIWYRHYTWSPISSELQACQLEVSILRSVGLGIFPLRPGTVVGHPIIYDGIYTNPRWLVVWDFWTINRRIQVQALSPKSMPLDCWTTRPAWWSDQWVYYLFNGILGGGFKYVFLMFTPIWGRFYDPLWRTYFSDGLGKKTPLQGYSRVIVISYNSPTDHNITCWSPDPFRFDLTNGTAAWSRSARQAEFSEVDAKVGWRLGLGQFARPVCPKRSRVKRRICFQRFAGKNLFWLMVSNIFYFHPYLGKCSNLTNIFQMGWNHQLVLFERYLRWCPFWKGKQLVNTFRIKLKLRYNDIYIIYNEIPFISFFMTCLRVVRNCCQEVGFWCWILLKIDVGLPEDMVNSRSLHSGKLT